MRWPAYFHRVLIAQKCAILCGFYAKTLAKTGLVMSRFNGVARCANGCANPKETPSKNMRFLRCFYAFYTLKALSTRPVFRRVFAPHKTHRNKEKRRGKISVFFAFLRTARLKAALPCTIKRRAPARTRVRGSASRRPTCRVGFAISADVAPI